MRAGHGAPFRLQRQGGAAGFLGHLVPAMQGEIPWFVEFERSFKDQGFAVLVSRWIDDGWNLVRPFVERNK
jgi:hypothetical protein